jgi:two-component system sensor histidine kinase EvgS
MTAHVLDQVLEKCYENGIDDCIAKPFQLDILQKKILSLTNLSNSKKEKSIDKSKYLDLFITSFLSDYKLLKTAIEKNNKKETKYLLHKMKGSALTMDFNELAELLLSMEQKKLLDLSENLNAVKSSLDKISQINSYG